MGLTMSLKYTWEPPENPLRNKIYTRIAELEKEYEKEDDYWVKMSIFNSIGALRSIMPPRR